MACIHFGIYFWAIYLAQEDGSIVMSDGTVHTGADGTIEICDRFWVYNQPPSIAEGPLIFILAGMAASHKSRRCTYGSLLTDNSVASDWKMGVLYVQANEAKKRSMVSGKPETLESVSAEYGDMVLSLAIPVAKKFVVRHWEEVEKVADALLASPTRRLGSHQVGLLISPDITRPYSNE